MPKIARTTSAAVTIISSILLLNPVASAQQPARPPAGPPADAPAMEWISVVLIAGEMEAGAADAREIPAAVQQALTDVRELLPFRSYRMYDAGLTRPPRPGSPHAVVRLRGLTASRTLQARLSLVGRYALPAFDPPGADRPVVAGSPISLAFSLTEVAETGAEQVTSTLMTTTVTISAGETVVVGTSRNRGQALIVLLTAVPPAR